MIKKLFRQMLITQTVSAMTVTLCMLIDSIMIGRFLGVDSMTAYGLATPVLLVFAALGSMISAGVQVMCGRTMGSGDKDGTDACFTASVALAVIISAVGLAAVLLFTDPICTLLGAGRDTPDNPVFGLTKDYLRGFIIGAPAFIAAQIMVPYMQISGSRIRLVVAVAAMTITDVVADILNAVVIKGGTFGMGLASSLSYYVAFVIGIVYFFKKDCIFKLRKDKLSLAVFRRLAGDGVPTLINQISLVLLTFALNKLLIETGGNRAVAAYSVISTVGNICYAFSTGVAAVVLTLSAIFYGDADRSALKNLIRIMVRYGIIICGTVTVVVLAAASPLVTLFLEDKDAKGLAVNGLRLFVLSLVPCVLNTSFKNYYQGVGREGFTKLISVLQNFALPVASAVVLSRFLKVTGIWLGFVCGEGLTLVMIAAVVFVHNKKPAVTAEAFSMLNDDLGVSEDRCLELSITGGEQISEAASRAQHFCLEKGIAKRDSTLISLCIEEMSNNIVEYGFRGSRDHNIDIRVTIGEKDTTIRIRDNCIHFDPVKYMQLHNEDDAVAHIGIRMVMKMVKNANYVNSLGLNNLTLVL